MSGSLIGALRVTLGIDTAAFEQGLGAAQKKLNTAGATMQAFGSRLTGIGQTMSVAVTAPLVAFGVSAVQAANESAAALAQVNAALDSMGPVAGKTSEQLQKAAEDLQHLSTFDDDDILKSVTANMLTFGNISGEAFDRAQLAVVNLSARMGTDLQSATLMIGKALNDPVKGLAALGRAGIQFTADQKALIKSLVEGGDAAGAQAIMLTELERQFGGAAKAARDAAPGSDTVDAWREFQETVGAIIVQVLPPLTDILTGVLDSFNNLSPATQGFVVGFAAVAAAAGPVLMIVGSLVSAAGSLTIAFAPAIAAAGGVGAALGAAALAAAPFVAAGVAVAAAWYAFGDKIGPVLEALKTKFQEVLGPKLQSLFNTVKTTLTDLWNGPFGEAIRVVIDVLGDFGAAYTSVLGEVLLRILSALVTAVENSFRIIGDVFRVIGALLRGDFAGAWNAVKELVSNVVNGWIAVLNSLAPEAVAAIRALVAGVQEWIGRRLTAVWDKAKEVIQSLGDKFKWLWDVVVGNSYVPDLFDGIQREARRFMPEFVTPLMSGIDAVAGSFAGLDFTMPPLSVPDFQPPANDNPGQDESGVLLPGNDPASDMREAFRRSFSDGIKAALDGDLKGFFQSWFEGAGNRAMENILNAASDALFDLLTKVLGGAGGAGSGDLGSVFTSVFSSIFGRASGGPVLANKPYIVGEKRPELFVPSTSGRIVPNMNELGRRGANDGLPPSMSFNFYGPVTNPQEVRRSAAQAGAHLLRISAAGKRGV
ncbi:phage tail length tape measure family protein [Erythrobacter sp. CCH5-A1]|jgi:phage-related protein|uniref:phage tail length tape measure family protein n=1 Tax=Erythrobacter sp. CCH5-A1 TaxID=1768792 RepID=UPI00083253F2|nr:phage tail length tape measure family protein [Erythrobacter sp. CCH5-A1]